MIKWYDIRDYQSRWRSINIIIGARGVGKTYSAIDFMMNLETPFIYLRNKNTQIESCASAFGNPFKRWMKDKNKDIRIAGNKNISYISDHISDDEIHLKGYMLPLSTFENLRGVDLSDVTHVLFDEFIERDRLHFDQFSAFMNFYETVNRNRELLGEPALQVFMLSNAQKLDSPILAGLGLVTEIENMIRNGQKNFSSGDVWLSLPESMVSEEKKNTALYRVSQGTKYFDEAIQNKFANDSFYNIKKMPLNEYQGFAMIDGIYLYKHKSNGSLYACNTVVSNVPEYDSTIQSIAFYRPLYAAIAGAYASGRMYFSDFMIKSKLLSIIK